MITSATDENENTNEISAEQLKEIIEKSAQIRLSPLTERVPILVRIAMNWFIIAELMYFLNKIYFQRDICDIINGKEVEQNSSTTTPAA